MEKGKTKTKITFQIVSEYDQTLEKFVERVSRYLRDYLAISYDFSDIRKFSTNKELDLVLGDIIPPSFVLGKEENIKTIEYHLFDYPSVEDIIKEVNFEVYGESLVQIPNSDIIYIIKIISDFSCLK